MAYLSGPEPKIRDWRVTHASYEEGIPEVSGDINLAELFPWTYELIIVRGQSHHMVRVEDLPPEAAADVLTCSAISNKSVIDVSLLSSSDVRHVLVLNNVLQECEWPEDDVSRLRLLGEVFVNALERKRSEEVLSRNEARLKLATESADAGLWELDVKSRHFWATPKAYDLYEMDRDTAVSFEAFLARVHEEDRERVRLEVMQTIESGVDFRTEYRLVLKDGSLRWIAARGRLHPMQGAAPDVVTGISFDVTAP